MEISGDTSRVWFEPARRTVHFEGTCRLGGTEAYVPISTMLQELLTAAPLPLTIDLIRLQFLNSSGINMLCKFVIAARQAGAAALSVQGTRSIVWHAKSLPNLKKLYPALHLVID